MFLSVTMFLLMVAFSACSGRKAEYVIAVSQCSEDEWRAQMNKEILREAAVYGNVEVWIRSAGDDTRRQQEDVRYFMEQKVDLIVVAPNEGEAMTGVVSEAYRAGIPVIVVDRKILSDDYSAFIGADNQEIGRSVGNYVASLLKGKGRIVEVAGLLSSTPAMERHEGFSAALAAYPSIELVAVKDAGWNRHQSEEMMDSLWDSMGKVDLIFAQNDRMAAGVFESALKRGNEASFRLIGVDALPGEGCGVDMVLNDVLDATFIYPTGGDIVIQTALDILQGNPYQRQNILTTAVVDSTNARIMDLQTKQVAKLDDRIALLNGRLDVSLTRYSIQQVVLGASLVVLILAGGLLFVVWKSLKTKNRLNRALSDQKLRVEEQRDTLEQQKSTLEQQKTTLEEQRDTLSEQRDRLIELSKQLEEATHAKLVFFTNISHDFRTPLTLVADPVEQLLADSSLSKKQRDLLELIRKNVRILLKLVNQILDFRKFENGKMMLTVSMMDLRTCLTEWNDAFRPAVLKKHIHFSFAADPHENFRIGADVEKLERIYFNLLSNAFKFTPENGIVSVSLERAEGGVRILVNNSGSVISAEHMRNIFERFYQIDRHHAGSGIGLALVKAYVDLHGGNIEVKSDGKSGTTFTVWLPDHPCENVALEKVETLPLPELEEVGEPGESDDTVQDDGRPSVLVIDDNPDIRAYVLQLLSETYRVYEASDGSEGIRKAMRYVPDLIISDVMMPGMDGIECCKRLKSEVQTCHIPVILLTACSLDEQRIEGYDCGADSYISKPFTAQLLLSRVRNLIASRHRLKEVWGDRIAVAKEELCDLDKDFISKLKDLMEQRLGDSNLNVEDMGREMGLSRVQLYRKVKALTNYAPNELLRVTRLRKASALLAASELSVAEVAYEVGFTSPSYFTKCYKELFGESPTDFLKRKENKDSASIVRGC